jgi:hypothetical protein
MAKRERACVREKHSRELAAKIQAASPLAPLPDYVADRALTVT